MPSPFSRFHTDEVSVEKQGGTSGRGRPIAGVAPIPIRGSLIKNHKQKRSPDGSVIDHRGTFEFDPSRYTLAIGDVLVAKDGIKYVIDGIDDDGAERMAVLKWLE